MTEWVARSQHLGLLGKTLPLYQRIIQLCVGIAHFPLVHKQLKALCHAWHVTMPAPHHVCRFAIRGRKNEAASSTALCSCRSQCYCARQSHAILHQLSAHAQIGSACSRTLLPDAQASQHNFQCHNGRQVAQQSSTTTTDTTQSHDYQHDEQATAKTGSQSEVDVPFGKWGHQLRVVADETWADELLL